MYVATNGLTIARGHGAELEELFRRQGGVKQQPGFLGFELWRLRSDGDTEEFLVVTHWESEETHAEWVRSDAFRQAHAGPHPEYILGPGQSRSYDVKISYGAEG